MSSTHAPETDAVPFSRLVRERSASTHRTSAGAGFMHELLQGTLDRDDYARLVMQHWAIYGALEGTRDLVAPDETVAPFLSPELDRLPSIEADLQFLMGDAWRDDLELLPATQHYAARIREVAATWPAGYLAHHYTRYLGDLSGGIQIGKAIARQFGFESHGTEFYRFDLIPDPTAFKAAYRARLDDAAFTDDEKQLIVDEVLRAYDDNARVLAQLAEH